MLRSAATAFYRRWIRRPSRARIEHDNTLIARSGLFDAAWYGARHPDIVAKGENPLWHYCKIGAYTGYNPNPLFDSAWYLDRNPDVTINPLVHFIEQGVKDSCDPCLDFDVAWYLDSYVDIAVSGMNPLDHFLNYGEAEGRDPNPMFSTVFYRKTYSDELAVGTSPIDHFRRLGKDRGYRTKPIELDPYLRNGLAQAQSFGAEVPELVQHIRLMPVRPYFICLMADRASAERTLSRQIYPDWALGLTSDGLGGEPHASLVLWHVVWDEAFVLDPSALYCLASAINREPDCDFVSCEAETSRNADSETPAGDHNSPAQGTADEAAGQFNLAGRVACVSQKLFESVGPYDLAPPELARHASCQARRIGHVPSTLMRRPRLEPSTGGNLPMEQDSAMCVAPPRRSIARFDIDILKDLTTVVYLARGADPDCQARFARFLRSYAEFDAGAPHRLAVIFKGFRSSETLALAQAHFAEVEHDAYEFDDLSFDIGAYAEASRRISCDRICFLNTNSEIASPNWLLKLILNLEQPGIGIVGATGSFEAHLCADPRWPSFPNVHVRTNAFMMRSHEARAVLGNMRIQSKYDAHCAEHGYGSVTREILARGLAPLIVGQNGRGYSPLWWRRSDTFRQGSQSNVLIHDNQTRFFAAQSAEDQKNLQFRAWGRLDEKTLLLTAAA